MDKREYMVELELEGWIKPDRLPAHWEIWDEDGTTSVTFTVTAGSKVEAIALAEAEIEPFGFPILSAEAIDITEAPNQETCQDCGSVVSKDQVVMVVSHRELGLTIMKPICRECYESRIVGE